jgi:hypothetical protein
MRLVALIATLVMLIAPAAAAEEGKTYGKGVDGTGVIKVSELVANAEKYVGQTVRVEGVVIDVCAKRGCWMDLKSDGGKVRIKVDDGVMVFPMDAKGKHAVAEGVFTKIEMTPEEARAAAKHLAEEKGQALDAANVPDAPTVVYQIAGTGAVIK